MPLGAPLVVQTVFVIKEWAPSAAKVLPRLEKLAKNDTKEPPSAKMSSKSQPFSEPGENELQKWTLFGSRPGGLREALKLRSTSAEIPTQKFNEKSNLETSPKQK